LEPQQVRRRLRPTSAPKMKFLQSMRGGC
jgi:hypothetical protein